MAFNLPYELKYFNVWAIHRSGFLRVNDQFTVTVYKDDEPYSGLLYDENGEQLSNPFGVSGRSWFYVAAEDGSNYTLEAEAGGAKFWRKDTQFLYVDGVIQEIEDLVQEANEAAEAAAESAAEAEGKVLAFKEQELGYFTHLIGEGDSLVSFLEGGGSVEIGYVARVNSVDDSSDVLPSTWKCTATDAELPGGATPGELYEGKLYVENGSGGYYVFEYVGEGSVDATTGTVRTFRSELASAVSGLGSRLIAFVQSGLGAIKRWVEDKLAETVSIEDFGGGTEKSAAENTDAAAKAIAHLVNLGGGVLNINEGLYLFACGDPDASSWDNRACIWHNTPGVRIKIKGKGVDVTTLKMDDGQNAHMIKGGQRVGGDPVEISGLEVEDLTIDHNRDNQVMPDDTQDHQNAIDIASGASGVGLRRLKIVDAMYYGIGFQQDYFYNCHIEDIEIDRSGADGIDCKDNSGQSHGNTIRNLRVKNWGLLGDLSLPQAGIDLRSGWRCFDLAATDPGDKGLIGLRLQSGVSGGTPVQATKVYGYRGYGNDALNSVGARVISRNCSLYDAHVMHFSDGFSLSDPDARFFDLRAENNNVGFRLWQNSGGGTEADVACLIGIVARNNTQAGIVYDSVDEITVLGADVRNNGIGHDIRSGSSYVRIIGGSCTGNTTAIQDNGSYTIVQYVSGLRTRSIVSTEVEIDSAGTKNFTIAHTLNVTPNINDVCLTLRRNTNVGDWVCGFLWVTAVDATNIYGQIRVVTASATSGAVVDVVATIEAKATTRASP